MIETLRVGDATVQAFAQVMEAAAVDARRTLATVCGPAVLALLPAIEKDLRSTQRAMNATLAALVLDHNAGRVIGADLSTRRVRK